jgi:hypothetical protein
MSEQLDDELKRRISDVFDSYEEDDLAADEGWLLLREKYPEKAERRRLGVWFWRGMAAAVLLILSLAGLFLQQRRTQTSQLAGNRNRIKPATHLPSSGTKPSSRTDGQPPQAGSDAVASQHPATEASPAAIPSSSPEIYTGIQPSSSTHKNNYQLNLKQNNPLYKPTAKQNAVTSNIDPVYTPESNSAILANTLTGKRPKISTGNNPVLTGSDSAERTTVNAILAQQKTATANAHTDTARSLTKKPSMMEILANDQKQQVQQAKNEKKNNSNKGVTYSVYAATYLNYAKGSTTQPNLGAGFTSDIRITGKLKLSTGLAIAQNKLNYSSEPTQPGIISDAIRASSRGTQNQLDMAPVTAMSLTGRTIDPPVEVKSYNVSLTGLDVPINLKYEFNPQKSDSFIAAGLSSSTFINETYRYQYNNNRNVLGSNTEIPDAQSKTAFSRFDFARTLNLAVGMGVQLGKSNRLVVEPFLKYPLDGLGSQQIRFGTSGVNLKLKFQKAKK